MVMVMSMSERLTVPDSSRVVCSKQEVKPKERSQLVMEADDAIGTITNATTVATVESQKFFEQVSELDLAGLTTEWAESVVRQFRPPPDSEGGEDDDDDDDAAHKKANAAVVRAIQALEMRLSSIESRVLSANESNTSAVINAIDRSTVAVVGAIRDAKGGDGGGGEEDDDDPNPSGA